MGNAIRRHYRLEDKTEFSLGAGLMVMESFVEEGILRWYASNPDSGKHSAYYIRVKEWSKWNALKEEFIADDEKLPFDGWPKVNEDWVSGTNLEGLSLIRDSNKDASVSISPETHPLLLNSVNKLQRTKYTINRKLYALWKQLREEARDKSNTKPSPFKFVGEKNKQRATSYVIEADTIELMVDKLLDETIQHTYNCDFRGRIYNTTVFLEEQASDQAKALLQYDDSCRYRRNGLQWLMIYTCNMYGNDKIPIEDRISFVEDNQEKFIGYAKDPLNNRGWLAADKPWSFLMCCIELEEVSNWVSRGLDYTDFPSKLVCFIDGSNNGIQHLVAMSRDDDVAPYVNLTETESLQAIPGDVYMYIADKTWEKIDALASNCSEELVSSYDSLRDSLYEVSKEIYYANSKADKQVAYEKLTAIKDDVGDSKDLAAYAPLWWKQFKGNRKLQRKMVKRNVMTIGYGATKGGMGQQARDDIPDMFADARWIPGGWHFWFGALVHDMCYEHLEGPASMLQMFRSVAESCNDRDTFLSYNTPHTNFPVVQHYRKPMSKRAEFNFCGKTIKPQFVIAEQKSLNKQKQLSSTAPNVTHSLDAAHLTMVISACPFPVTTVHDSFGCHAGNMADMFSIVREQFYELYRQNPLESILDQAGCKELLPEPKGWQSEAVMKSDFAFC